MSKLKNYIDNNLKYTYIIACVCFCLPTIVYFFTNKLEMYGGENTWTLVNSKSMYNRMVSTIVYLIFVLLSFYLYFKIIKNCSKLFKSFKSIIIFILIISGLFAIVLPMTSSDVFYYISIGHLETKYNLNPYYHTIAEIGKGSDVLFHNCYWYNYPCVYGPIWAFICKILSYIFLDNIYIALYIHKIVALIIHLLTCLVIYKTTNKKMFSLIYGLNPLVLFECLTNVHNDGYVILFTIIGMYFILKKRNIIMSLLFLAIATSIKYFTIFLVPFILIYYFRKEKLSKKILLCIIYGFIYLLIFASTYLLYAKDARFIFNII